MASEAVFPNIGVPTPDTVSRGVPSALPGADQRQVFTQPPSGPSPASFLDRINYSGLEQFGASVDNLTQKLVIDPKIQQAQQDGAQAVSRDPNTGQLSVSYQPPIFAWNKAYNDAASKSYVAQANGDIQQNAFALAQKNPTDPVAFQSAYKAFADGYIAKAPAQVRGDLTDEAAQLGAQFTEGIAKGKASYDISNAKTALQSQYSEYTNQAYALARQGGENTPDIQAAVAKAKSVSDQMVANPLFGYTPADQTRDAAELQGGMQAQAIIGHAINAGRADGEQSGLDLLNQGIWDPKLNLSTAQRSSFEAQGRSMIREEGAASRAMKVAAQQDVSQRLDDAYASAVRTGSYTNIVRPNDIIAAFGKYDGAQKLEKLNQGVALYTNRKVFAVSSPQEDVQLLSGMDPSKGQPPQTPSGFDAAWGFTLQHEGGYSAHDANGAPVNFGINQAAHPEVDVSKLTPDTAKPIAKAGYWDKIGGDTLAPNMQAAAFDTAYIFGPEAAKPMIDAAGGDPQKLIALRSQKMQQMAASDPAKYGRFDHAWEQRNNDLSAFVSGAGGQEFSEFAAKSAEYEAGIKAVNEKREQLTKDPAAYVASVQPTVAQQLQSNDPGTFQNGLRSSVQMQAHLGVVAPRVLSKPQATAIVQQFANRPDGTKAADGMNQVIGTVAQQFGPYFPQAMKELKAAGLPSEAYALYQTMGMGGPNYRMATAINAMQGMDGKNPNEQRDSYFKNAPNNSEIGKAIPGVMSDYADSLRGNPDGPQLLASTQYSANLYARQLSYEGVNDPQKAAQQAHDDLIASRYHFVDGYRVPVGQDDAMVKRGADTVLSTLPAAALEPHGLPVPGVANSDRQQSSQSILRAKGQWITRSDDKGLYLAWPAETGYTPAISSDGKPLSFSWAQLQQVGHNTQPSAKDVATPAFHGAN